MLLPKIIDKTYKTKVYLFIKDGEYHKKYISQNGFKKGVKEFLAKSTFPKETQDYLKNFDCFTAGDLTVEPKEDSIKFKGNIYLLIDNKVYSSAEGLAVFAKESGLAILAGETTKGDGIGSDSMQFSLPNSGFVIRYSKEMGVSQSGVINELYATSPHIETKVRHDDDRPLPEREYIKAILEREKISIE